MQTSFVNSSIHYEPHRNYIRGVDLENCRYFARVNVVEYCQYVRVTPPCSEGVTKFNYATIIFCDLPSYTNINLHKAVLILCSVFLLYMLFMIILTLILIPNVLYLAKVLGMAQHTAGVTVMVIFYGLPDLFASLWQFHRDSVLVVNQMMGISLYLRSFQSGLLIYHYPFALYRTFFIRDSVIIAFAFVVLYHIVVDQDEQTSVFEGIFAMLFYPGLCYIVYLQHFSTKEARRRAELKELPEKNRRYLKLAQEITLIPFPLPTGVTDPLQLGILRQFLLVANVYNEYNLGPLGRWQKILLIFGFFFAIPIKLSSPVVHPMAAGYGWSRLLVAINLFLSPLVIYFVSFRNNNIFMMVAVFGALVSSIFLLSTRTNIPKYQTALAIYGCALASWTIHVVEAEINSVLLLIGNILGFKRLVTACTLLSWGDCIPEVVGWLTFSRWKLNTLPLVAFLSAPLFNMIFFMGAQVLQLAYENRSVYAATRAGDVAQTCTWFTCVHHCVFFFATLCTDFRLRRSVGIYSILVYFLFLLFLCLDQEDIIHAFGTDHMMGEAYSDDGWA